MSHRGARTARGFYLIASAATVGTIGCVGPWNRPLRDDAHIRRPVATEAIPAAPSPTALPEAPAVPAPKVVAGGILELPTVLDSVRDTFPLLYAAELERPIAAGQRIAAEGQFDTVVRSRFVNQNGSFDSRVFDVGIEQATPYSGATFTAGYRTGFDQFPVYNGDRLTAEGGEFRVGATVPLLRGSAIDPRRARVRAARITQQLADPIIRRARLDFDLAAARAYWTWVQSGARYEIAADVLKLAEDRQKSLDQRKGKVDPGDVAVDNLRLVNLRKSDLVRARRGVEQAGFQLSLFYRDAAGNPIVPKADQLPRRFIDTIVPKPDPTALAGDAVAALQQRPELVRFQLLRQRLGIDLKLALNDFYPTLNAVTGVSQDAGAGKKDLDRTNYQAGVVFEMPLARRDALGRTGVAQAQIVQTLLNERDARDRITAELQDAVSELVRTYEQLELNRIALEKALEVRDFEERRFKNEVANIIALNIREVVAVEAENAVVNAVADYFRAVAVYRAVLGGDAPGLVLPVMTPQGFLPEVNRDPK